MGCRRSHPSVLESERDVILEIRTAGMTEISSVFHFNDESLMSVGDVRQRYLPETLGFMMPDRAAVRAGERSLASRSDSDELGLTAMLVRPISEA